MKKALKIIASVSAFAVIISAFCACENSSTEESTTAQQIIVSENDESTTAADITRPEETEPSSSSDKIEIDSLETILNNIKDLPIGTAGSTSKAYRVAYTLLCFTENSNFTANDAQQDYKNFIDSLDEEDKETYFLNLSEVDHYTRKIIEDPSVLDQYLDVYTPISEDGTITLANYEALYAIISK